MKFRTAMLLARVDAIVFFIAAFFFCIVLYLFLPALLFSGVEGAGLMLGYLIVSAIIPAVLCILCGIGLLRSRWRPLFVVTHSFAAFVSVAFAALFAVSAFGTYGGDADAASVLAIIVLVALFMWNAFFIYAFAFDSAFKKLFEDKVPVSAIDKEAVARAETTVRSIESSDQRIHRILVGGTVMAFIDAALGFFLLQGVIVLAAIISPNAIQETIFVLSTIGLAIVAFVSAGTLGVLFTISSKRIILIRTSLAALFISWGALFILLFPFLADTVGEDPVLGIPVLVVALSVVVSALYGFIVSFRNPVVKFIVSERKASQPPQ